jgi:hypothetical protein
MKRFKAYVRIDGSGRSVPSSLILRKNKPKVGKWVEVTAYGCCNPTSYPLKICVSGIATGTDVNNTYDLNGTADGRPKYTQGLFDVYWNNDDSLWHVSDAATSAEDVADPTLVQVWSNVDPSDDVLVTEGICLVLT